MATVAPSWQLAVCDSVLGMHAPAAQSGPQSGAVIIASSVIVARAIRKRLLIGVTRVISLASKYASRFLRSITFDR